MAALEQRGVCLFCRENLSEGAGHRVFHQTTWWTLTNNRFPYSGTRLHLLLIPAVHVSDMVDLPEEARAEFWDVLGWARQNWELTFYGLGVRCGDSRFTGATLEHLHLHLIVGDVFAPMHEPVRLKLSAAAPPPRAGENTHGTPPET